MLSDISVVRFLAAVIIANRMPQLDPTFAFLVSNSSGGKSALLDTLKQVAGINYLDDLTAKTFVSGARRAGTETSYLFSLGSDPILVLTDFTLLLDKNEEEAKQIMSQLRLIYDGKLKKRFGTGDEVDWQGRLGFLAGVTTAVYDRQAQYAALGERMIYYYMEQPDRFNVTQFALKGISEFKKGREEMAKAMHEYIDGIKIPLELIEFPEDQFNNLVKLSEMATRARSSVSRQKYHRDNPIEMVHAHEMPIRLAKQLLNLGQAMATMNEGMLEFDDFRILYKVALDSIPLMRKKVMEAMTTYEKADVYGLAGHISLPFETVKKIVDDLSALGVIDKALGWGKGHYYFTLKLEYRELISEFQHIPITIGTLKKEEESSPQQEITLE